MLKSMTSFISNQYAAVLFTMDQDHITRLMWMSSLFMMAFVVILMPAYYFDTRLLEGSSVWAKPIKFSLSFAMHFFTLALLAQQLEIKLRTGFLLKLFSYLAVGSMLFEIIYMSTQSGRGRRSHYNLETTYEMLMYILMGVGGTLLVTISFILGVMIWKHSKSKGSNQGLFFGSVIGLVSGSVLTLVAAGYMSSTMSHLVGDTVNNVNNVKSVPLMGWSRSVGDMRISHFLSTHLMQILPLIGWLCDHYRLPAKRVVLISSFILISISLWTLITALLGKPLY